MRLASRRKLPPERGAFVGRYEFTITKLGRTMLELMDLEKGMKNGSDT
jgi:hypothetical protein